MSERVIRVPFSLQNRNDETIVGDVWFRSAGKRMPAAVVLHSFMAFKDWGWFPFVCKKFAGAGFASVIFNFSRNGIRENPNRITDFESFQRNTITQELEDAQMVLDSVFRGTIGPEVIDPERLMLLGHSRGGGLAILTVGRDARIRGIATWSSVSTFDRWTPHQKEQWRKLGFLPLSKDTSASPLKLGLDLLEDVEQNRERLDILKAASTVKIPWLILHATEDLLVRFSEGQRLYAAANKATTQFTPIEAAGHTYGGPEAKEGSAMHRILNATIEWSEEHVK